ncbi:phospholipase C [Kocuria sp. HSID16901]|uniref:phospholipase C n=1 Tax=Kocuria sp. HSID16901 TaxID=2419505 RepID=UPI00080A82CE|nr:alkaline phosphatase family protein [Kocuria sp. HSID16901]RUQ23328.1 phospholipase [Kocuria sp. HSID16901]
MRTFRWRSVINTTTALALATGTALVGFQAHTTPASAEGQTSTPIKHVVVIFDENISFDHYFGTYPNAANKPGEELQGGGAAGQFTADPNTPQDVKTLTGDHLDGDKNPNAVKPFRLTPEQAVTCDQNHNYGAEQQAYNGGTMDKFVESVSKDKCASAGSQMYEANGETMGYYDGNTVTALWNYAQNYAMSDNSFSSNFGPSTPGALNLISGNTHGATSHDPKTGDKTATPDPYAIQSPDKDGVGTVINDPDPLYDDCSNKSGSASNNLASLSGRNVGDMLNEKDQTWGWFQGGFRPSTPASSGTNAKCETKHANVAGQESVDYSPHHNPFAYYKSTANEHHTAPANVDEIGHNGQANHNYDLDDFDSVVNSDNMPAVSFLKAGEYQDGHAAYSDPVDEQHFLTHRINQIQASKNWKDTAVVVAYDDSDGWYDHVAAQITNASNDTSPKGDQSICTDAAARGVAISGGYQDRCGPGTRQPLLVISPYAKTNYVDHTQTDQASVLRFIEDNWGLGRVGDHSFDEKAGSLNSMFDFARSAMAPALKLNESNGTVVSKGDSPSESPTPSNTATPSAEPSDSTGASTGAAPSAGSQPSDSSSAPASSGAAPGVVPDDRNPGAGTSQGTGGDNASTSNAAPGDESSSSSSSDQAGGQGASDGLASTGAKIGLPIAIGLILLMIGLGLYFASRRSRQQEDH